jgi:hypothetical protein
MRTGVVRRPLRKGERLRDQIEAQLAKIKIAQLWCGGPGGCLSPAVPRLTAASRISGSSSLLHRYDEPEILPSSIQPRCLIGADAEHRMW